MAQTEAGKALTRNYRQAQQALRAQAIRDLVTLWPALDWTRLQETYPAWFSAVSLLIQRDRRTSAGLASAYLRAFRLAEHGPGDFSVVLAQPLPAEQLAVSLRATTLGTFLKGIRAGFPIEKAAQHALVTSLGSSMRLMLNGGRDTVVETLRTDPAASGWRRITTGGCDFCVMLAGRGDVYSAQSVDFAAHDHCFCSAEPDYGTDSKHVKRYQPSTRNIPQADKDRARAWIAEHLQ